MRNEKGITLVELIAALAIVGIITVVIASVLMTGTSSADRTVSKQQLQQEANLIVEQIRASYLENEKSDSVTDNFKVKVRDDELKITTIDDEDIKSLSKGYEYHLGEDLEMGEITLDRTETSPFYLKVCSDNQCFTVQTSFSKLN